MAAWARTSWTSGASSPGSAAAHVREIRDCKFRSNRKLPLYGGLARLLGPSRQATGLVFLDSRGNVWNETGPAQEFLSEAYKAAGIRRDGVLWHALRHTYASLLAAGGLAPLRRF